jgi:hypothetical protein
MRDDLRKANLVLPCRIKELDGTSCLNRATHFWGTITFCCDHFDEFVIGMFDLSDEMRSRRHVDLLRYYAKRTRVESRIDPPSEPEDKSKG